MTWDGFSRGGPNDWYGSGSSSSTLHRYVFPIGNAISQGQGHLSRDHKGVKNTSLIAKHNYSFPLHNFWWPCYCLDVIYKIKHLVFILFINSCLFMVNGMWKCLSLALNKGVILGYFVIVNGKLEEWVLRTKVSSVISSLPFTKTRGILAPHTGLLLRTSKAMDGWAPCQCSKEP